MKKTLRILIALALLVAIAATAITVYFIRFAGDEGTTPLEAWIGAQLKAVAGSHLNVEIDFEKPDYQYPSTIVVQNIRLTAPDPADEKAKPIDIIRIGKAILTVADIPAVGQPLHIERVILEQPEFSFICTSETDATLIGFSNLVKTSGDPAPIPDPSLPPAKITDVFRIRLIHILNGRVIYDPRHANKRAMNLDHINLALNVEPDKDGWYTLATKIDRAPIGELDLQGRFNLNENILDLSALSLMLKLGGENNASLPPQMQGFLADHDLRGELNIQGGGTIKFSEWKKAKLDLALSLHRGNITFGEYRIDVPRLAIKASMADEQVKITEFDGRSLGGAIKGNAQIALNETYDAQIKLNIEDMYIQRALKAGTDAGKFEELPFRGRLNLDLSARAPLTNLTQQLNGGGNLTLREGRLVALPGVTMIEDAIAGSNSDTNAKRKAPGAADDVYLLFTFKNDRMRVDRLDYRSTLIAVRGTGYILLQGLNLDLMVNAGPIEKLQSILGPIGTITAPLTDRIAKYHITGVIGKPSVKAIIAEGFFDHLFGK